jgi:hypothetical protein
MDVIGFLCVPLGSSSFMTVQVADAHAHIQWLVSVVKKETRFEEYTTEKQLSVVRFLWARGPTAKDIYKEMFLVYGGKCLSHKVVHNWIEKFSQGHSKVADDAQPGHPVEILTVKRLLLCSGFRSTGTAMAQVYECWWRICQEIHFFPRFEYHMFYILYPFVTYLLTLCCIHRRDENDPEFKIVAPFPLQATYTSPKQVFFCITAQSGACKRHPSSG